MLVDGAIIPFEILGILNESEYVFEIKVGICLFVIDDIVDVFGTIEVKSGVIFPKNHSFH